MILNKHMKSLSSKTYQCGVTIQGLTTLAGTTYLTGITNTTSWEHVIVGTTAQGQIYTRTYAQFMTDVATGIGLSGYVPTSRTLSINGVTYDLTANRSWTITTPYVSKLQHSVKAGVAINKGQAVYVTSADGTNMIVGLASNASEATSSKTMGLLDATVVINGFANVVTEGLLAGLDTSTAGSEGDPVWLGTGGNLIYGLANKPYAPAHLVSIGIVTRKNINNGEIFVKVQNGFELKEIHDVDLITTAPINGHLLGYDGTLWVNKTIAGWLGYTPANASGTTNYLSKFTGSTTLGDSKIVDNGSNIQFLVNSQNANSKFYMSPVHGDGRINLNAVSGGNDVTLIRAWHDSNQLGLGTGSSAGGGALTTRGDSVLIGTSGSLLFMNGTFGPNNVPYRLGISASATVTYFSTGVNNNLTNIESNAFQYTAKSHTFYTGTTTGNQSEPNQYTPLFLSTGGNVVVGSTTDLGYKLEVKNTSGSSALRISNNNDGSGMRFGISNGANSQYLDLNYWVTLQAFAGYSMNLSVGSAYGVYLDSSNNVGIGTNSPAYKLHVAGTTLVQNTSNATLYINETGGNVGDVANLYLIGNNMGWGASLRYNVGAGGANNRLDFYTGTSRRMSIAADTGNLLINTITDSGYKLDVNGTARINSSLYFTDPAYTGAGRIYQAANSTFIVTGGPGGGSENITFGPSNRIFINASQTRVSSLFQIAGGLSVGTWNYPGTYGAQAYIGGSTTANAGGGRGLYIDSTVVAAANNDVLVGLDVNPTFTNGAFTGVSNFAARFGGNVIFTEGVKTVSIAAPATTGNGGALTISAGNATTLGQGGNISLQPGNGAGGPGAGTVIISNTSWWNGATVNGTLTVTNSGPNTGTSLQVNAGGQNGLTIYWDNLTPFMQYGLVSARQARFVNSSSYSFSNNLLVGTTTDAGYKLDVNGTARFSGNTYLAGDILVSNGSGTRYIQSPNGGIGFLSSNSSGYNLWTANTGVGIKSELYINSDLNYNTGIRLRIGSTQTSPSGYSYELSFQSQVNHVPTYTAIRTLDSSYGGNLATPSPIYIFGGQNTTTGVYAHVILQSDFTTARGYVGIGTTSPSQLLHVEGNLRLTGAFYDSNNSAGTAGQILKSTATGTDWVSLSEITGVDGTGTANYLAKWSDADTITTSLIYDNGTNITVGTSTGTVYLNSNIGSGAAVDINGQYKFYYAQLQGNGSAYFTTYVTVGATGNLGATLNVKGTGATSSTKSLYIANSDNTRTLSYTDDGKLTLSNGTYTTKWYTGSGYSPTLEFSAQGNITWGNGAIFKFYGTGDTTEYRLENGTFHTTNSQARFYAGGSGYLGFETIGATTAYDAIGAVFTDNNTVSLRFFYKNTASDIEGMRLTSSGNFLVGTTTDSGYKFDVNGTARIQGNLTVSSGNQLRLNDSTNANTATISYSSTGQQGPGVVSAWGGNGVFGWNNSVFNLLHAGTGNDVILLNRSVLSAGTTSGNALWLTGYGSFAPTTGTNSFNAVNIGVTYNATGGTSTIRGIYYNPVLTSMTGVTHRAIETVTGDVLFATTSGSVGIGTSSPSQKLEVNGNIGIPYTGYLISTTDVGNSIQLHNGSGVMNFYTNGSIRLSIAYSTGNVGIGTTSPTTKLDVNGVITATGGNSTNWNTAYGWGNHSSAGYVPQARTLTINGTSYDLSANRSWTIPTISTIQEAANNGKVTTAASVGTTVITTVATATYDGATFNYVLKDGTNYRAGTIIAVWSAGAVQFNETTTNDIGSTVGVTFAVALNAGNAELRATSATSGWTVKVVTIGI